MIEDSKKNKFDLIVTKEVSRFSRNLADSIKYSEELLRSNVGIYFLGNNTTTLDRNAEFSLHLLGSVAEEELNRLSERVKFGHYNSIKRGRVLGNNNIIGYKKDNTKLVIDDNEATFIRVLFELYASGEYGINKLAIKLKELGYLNNSGNIYDKSTLTRIIRNPKYNGYYRGHTTKVIDYKFKKRVNVPANEHIVFQDNNIPAIVNTDLWNKANEILSKRSKSFIDKSNKEIYRNNHTYSGKLFCFSDNKVFSRSPGKKSKNRPVWVCSNYIKERLSGCNTPIIAEIDLDNIFTDILVKVLGSSDFILEDMLKRYNNITTKDNYKLELKQIDKSIDLLDKKKDKLLEHNLNGNVSDSEFKLRNDKLNKDREILISKRESILNNRITPNNYLNDNLSINILNELNIKNNLKEYVNIFIDKSYIRKINNNRNNIKLDIYLNMCNSLSSFIAKYKSIEKRGLNDFYCVVHYKSFSL